MKENIMIDRFNCKLDSLNIAPEVGVFETKILLEHFNKKDIEERKLPNQTTGLVITNIGKNSPVNYLNAGDIIVEVQKKKISSAKDLEDIVDKALKSNQKTILVLIYNNQNQKEFIDTQTRIISQVHHPFRLDLYLHYTCFVAGAIY